MGEGEDDVGEDRSDDPAAVWKMISAIAISALITGGVFVLRDMPTTAEVKEMIASRDSVVLEAVRSSASDIRRLSDDIGTLKVDQGKINTRFENVIERARGGR